MVSESLKDAVADAKIHTEIFGSDHCPVELDLEELTIGNIGQLTILFK